MLLLSVWLFSAVRCEQSKIHVSAQEGELVNILCHYDSGYETYPKYFLKGIYGTRTTLINTSGKKSEERTQRERYYLWDDTKRRILHVTIHNLNLNDGGTYWCEIDANFFDPKTEIELKVYAAPAPFSPPPFILKHPNSTTVQAITRNQQTSTTVTESASSPTLSSTPPEDVHGGKELYLAVTVAAAALLLSLLVVLFCRLRKHRQNEAREFGCAVGPLINTYSTVIYKENHSQGQLREVDPSVNTSSSDSMYTAVTSRRGPDTQTTIYSRVSFKRQLPIPGNRSDQMTSG